MKVLLIVAAAFGAILLFLLATASANTALFARHYPWLLGLNLVVALSLAALVGWQVRQLWREHRQQVFGSRLKLRLMLFFGLMAVLPGVLIYGVSVQFLTKSIESWFDVRIEKALESGLALGRSALDAQLAELMEKAQGAALELADLPQAQHLKELNHQRELAGSEAAALFTLSGQQVGSATSGLGVSLPPPPSPTQLQRARAGRGAGTVEGDAEHLYLRALVPVIGRDFGSELRFLQLTHTVPAGVAQNAEAVQEVYRDYQELSLARQGLTQIYALTLTLTVLLALFAAFALAFVMARRLSAPLSILAEGTQAVAAGDYTPRQAIYSRDELGVLTQSFSQMTRQLDDARREAERHRAEVEAGHAYLESILANLSAGVLVFDRHARLTTVNAGAQTILADDFSGLLGEPVAAWPRQCALGGAIREGFAGRSADEWQSQLELERPNGMPQVLLLRGSRLPEASGGGHVVVFDDITRLIAAQRSAAWGEVARRLAHEIKNPLTPIQLSAERLQMKLADRLTNGDAEFLQRGTQTIINQVQAMKYMVDDFRDYARLPAPELTPLDLNALVTEMLGLYEGSHAHISAALAEGLPPVLGDATQVRQIIHNLLRNAEDAQEGQAGAEIGIATARAGRFAELVVADAGPGFPAEIMARVFEPYVTTKAKGTGLGLAIVRKIVDEHRGSIDITHRQPTGSRVVIRLPLAAEE
ncbi:MAG: ATP-binding protein [Azospira sp.]|jgi:nitrogen fixation/metabolism regulation signal transduction histidine kinase|nr:ATP-binding protein [Azospira sp.]